MADPSARKRRGRGEGSIYRRRDGYWVGQVEAAPQPGSGRRRRHRVVRRSRAEAAAALDDLRAQVEAGAVPDRGRTVSDLLNRWLDQGIDRVSPATLAKYRLRVRRVERHIGHVRLSAITTAHCQRLTDDLSRSLSPRTVRLTLGTAAQAFRWAVANDLLARDPVQGVILPGQPGNRHRRSQR